MARYGRAGSRGARSYRPQAGGGPGDDDGAGFCFAVVISMALIIGGIVYVVESFDDKRKINVEGSVPCPALSILTVLLQHSF
jgi:hypothetical protein